MNGEILSQIELVLPYNVVEAAYNLHRDCEAEFRAVNLDTKTSSEIALHKHADLSVRIRITVVNLPEDYDYDESYMHAEDSKETSESAHDGQKISEHAPEIVLTEVDEVELLNEETAGPAFPNLNGDISDQIEKTEDNLKLMNNKIHGKQIEVSEHVTENTAVVTACQRDSFLTQHMSGAVVNDNEIPKKNDCVQTAHPTIDAIDITVKGENFSLEKETSQKQRYKQDEQSCAGASQNTPVVSKTTCAILSENTSTAESVASNAVAVKRSHEEMAAHVLIDLSVGKETQVTTGGEFSNRLIEPEVHTPVTTMAIIQNGSVTVSTLQTTTTTGASCTRTTTCSNATLTMSSDVKLSTMSSKSRPPPLTWEEFKNSKERKEMLKSSANKTKVFVVKPCHNSMTLSRKLTPKTEPSTIRSSTIIHVPKAINRTVWQKKLGTNQLAKIKPDPTSPSKLVTAAGKPALAQCKLCKVVLSNNSNLLKHIRKIHSNHRLYNSYVQEIEPLLKVACPICGNVQTTEDDMLMHLKTHSKVEASCICPVCFQQYKTRSSMLQHMRQIHAQQNIKYQCQHCWKLFTEKRSLEEHINCTHETTQQFPCDICHKNFLTKGRLRRHKHIHGDYRFFCNACDKGFHLRDSMNKHVELMHASKENSKSFTCAYCGRVFRVKGNLKTHLLTVHMKAYPFQCPVCMRGFQRERQYVLHMKSHHGGKNTQEEFMDIKPNEKLKPTKVQKYQQMKELSTEELEGATGEELAEGEESGYEHTVAAEQIKEMILNLPICEDDQDIVPEPAEETII